MLVETEKCIYETKINLIQIEMTGFCNMNCKHCRANNEPKQFFPEILYEYLLRVMEKEKGDDFKLTFSGGEPFIHLLLIKFIKKAKNSKIENVVVTTNGSLVKKGDLETINKLKFENFTIQLSLDSLNEKKHDDFRNYNGAFKKVDSLLDEIKNYNYINSSIRMTITNESISQMEDMVKYAISKNCKLIGFGSVIPFGRASNCLLSLSKIEKREFLYKLSELSKKYDGVIDVVTEDPLKSLIENSKWYIGNSIFEECTFGGCTAGIDSINIQCDGIITPCSMIKEKILDLKECKKISDFNKKYNESELIKKLFERKFEGKCGNCKFNYQCGGCRASAKGRTDNLFGTDESCWLNDD